MSTLKGNSIRNRPQKYQNKTSFRNDLHNNNQKIKFLNSLQIPDVCKRCKDIIDWKIKYNKYKTLSAPKKCVKCDMKNVKYAYHIICGQCASVSNICAKCCSTMEGSEESEILETLDIKSILPKIPERRKRTLLRNINKMQQEKKSPDEINSYIEEIINKIQDANINEFDELC